MKQFLDKLIFSDLQKDKLDHNVLCHQWQNAKEIWENEISYKDENGSSVVIKSNAIGIERILKIVLILSQFLFPGIYLRHLFGLKGKLEKHIGVEFHVILKLVISLCILLNYWSFSPSTLLGFRLVNLWCFWMILETIFYTANLVFSEDVFAKPHSHKRNLILIVIDFLVLEIDFANLYLSLAALKTTSIINGKVADQIVTNNIDALYFSVITSMTIGYGDITPINAGKWLVIFQSSTILLFSILFLNFYISRLFTDKKQ